MRQRASRRADQAGSSYLTDVAFTRASMRATWAAIRSSRSIIRLTTYNGSWPPIAACNAARVALILAKSRVSRLHSSSARRGPVRARRFATPQLRRVGRRHDAFCDVSIRTSPIIDPSRIADLARVRVVHQDEKRLETRWSQGGEDGRFSPIPRFHEGLWSSANLNLPNIGWFFQSVF